MEIFNGEVYQGTIEKPKPKPIIKVEYYKDKIKHSESLMSFYINETVCDTPTLLSLRNDIAYYQ